MINLRSRKNFFAMFIDKTWKKVFFVSVSLLLFNWVLGLATGFNVIEIGLRKFLAGNNDQVIEFESPGWSSDEPGSWHITKSAEWTGISKARITFDVNSIDDNGYITKDVIIVLDTSASMNGNKLIKVKESVNELVEAILSNSNNRVALIQFNTNASILSNFTNDKKEITDRLSTLYASGNTNYKDALSKINVVLNDYEKKEGKNVVTLFLTDGYPSIDIPNQIGEFQKLKADYPYLIINGIQYEMGNSIIKEIKEISDNQYLAYQDNLQDILLDIAAPSVQYEKFLVQDFIDERYFELGNVDKVKASIGTASLSMENGIEKITWDLGRDYRTGSKATMTIDLNLKEEVSIDDSSIFTTNRKEKINVQLPEKEEEKIESNKTPKLKGAYKVIYEANTPAGCNVITNNVEFHRPFEAVTINGEDLSNRCSGYLFKGWELTDDSSAGTTKITDEAFIMPNKNIYVKGVWTKLAISKLMIAEKYEFKYLMPFNKQEGIMDNIKSQYVESSAGINFTKDASSTNGQGLYVRAGTEGDEYPIFYYRGNVNNNNVLFANKCWKIVRTTETGGTKLIYNGLPKNDGDICNNADNAISLPTSSGFSYKTTSPSDAGYMVGERYDSISLNTFNEILRRIAFTANYYYSKTYTVSGNKYILGSDAKQLDINEPYLSKEGYYTCLKKSMDSCNELYYIVSNDSDYLYTIPLSLGERIEEENFIMKLSTDFVSNIDGTYSLINPITIKRSEWYKNYELYNNYYICEDKESETCSSLQYITSTTNYQYVYMKAGDFNYANDVTWNGRNYELSEDNMLHFKTGALATNYNKLDNNHYTCFTNGIKCTSVYYIHRASTSSIFYIELKNGKKVEDALNDMFPNSNDRNKNNSLIKTHIDDWFSGPDGVLSFADELEDTIWCNDRTIENLGGWNAQGGSVTSMLRFAHADSNFHTPKIMCKSKYDRFTLKATIKNNNPSLDGNQMLDYPVGILTADEAVLAGRGPSSYLIGNFRTSSPSFYNSSFVDAYCVNNGNVATINVISRCNIRPSVSLRSGITITSGDGSVGNPYRIS